MTQEQITSATNIVAFILAIALIIALVFGLALCIIHDYKTTQMKQKLINSLDEHDKAVIATYKNTYWTWRKKPNANKNVSH